MNLMSERKKIDQIDESIAKLINERFKVVQNIKEIKKTTLSQIEHKDREEAIIKQNLAFIDQAYKDYFLKIYKTIIETSKDFQKQ
ncbi:MAG: chorismate mutase [Acholeplasmataceae bacterium]|nr:chorismate mutase [Acholeplasmataceae bacterium]